MSCDECGEYTRGWCGSCEEAVCFDCQGTVHDCDEDEENDR